MDRLFFRVFRALLFVLIAYGAGMALTILLGDDLLASRMISGFASMFAGILGFGTGYVLGSQSDHGGGDDEDDPPDGPG